MLIVIVDFIFGIYNGFFNVRDVGSDVGTVFERAKIKNKKKYYESNTNILRIC